MNTTTDESPRGLERDRAYELASRALEAGALGVNVEKLRGGKRFEVDANFDQGPYEVRHFLAIQDVADAFGLVPYFNALSYGLRVRFR